MRLVFEILRCMSVQDCSTSIVLAIDILEPCTKSLICLVSPIQNIRIVQHKFDSALILTSITWCTLPLVYNSQTTHHLGDTILVRTQHTRRALSSNYRSPYFLENSMSLAAWDALVFWPCSSSSRLIRRSNCAVLPTFSCLASERGDIVAASAASVNKKY